MKPKDALTCSPIFRHMLIKAKKKGQFIITGSNQFLLEEKITQSLAGRVSLLRLLPLSFQELKQAKKNNALKRNDFQRILPSTSR